MIYTSGTRGAEQKEGAGVKFIVKVVFPLEPFNTYVRQGTAWENIGRVLSAIKPEVIYFTDKGIGRGAVMIVDVESLSQIPHVTEPLMLTFGASVDAMSPDELQSAGLHTYATADEAEAYLKGVELWEANGHTHPLLQRDGPW
jgi:hypothetical protein